MNNIYMANYPFYFLTIYIGNKVNINIKGTNFEVWDSELIKL